MDPGSRLCGTPPRTDPSESLSKGMSGTFSPLVWFDKPVLSDILTLNVSDSPTPEKEYLRSPPLRTDSSESLRA